MKEMFHLNYTYVIHTKSSSPTEATLAQDLSFKKYLTMLQQSVNFSHILKLFLKAILK